MQLKYYITPFTFFLLDSRHCVRSHYYKRLTECFSDLLAVKLRPKLGFLFLVGCSMSPVLAQEKTKLN